MNYDESLNLVLLERTHFTLKSVRRRLVANGKTRGITERHILRVLNRETVDEDVVNAAKEAIALDKQFDQAHPIGLKTEHEIVMKYKEKETQFFINGWFNPTEAKVES